MLCLVIMHATVGIAFSSIHNIPHPNKKNCTECWVLMSLINLLLTFVPRFIGAEREYQFFCIAF